MDFELLKASIKRSALRIFLTIAAIILLIKTVGILFPENEFAIYIVAIATPILFILIDKPNDKE
ncbi:hypothetical protein VBD025_04355 [Virgibacillus flavescens]|uniref:hypothetical protein n=1 Tax=Virgibacillus flavescens TaxID=1611422 RepID=UPI003D342727